MKNTLRKVLSWALVLCMLVAVLPFGVFAEEAPADSNTITFDFTGLVTEGTKHMSDPTSLLYNKVDYGRNWKVSMENGGDLIAYPEYVEYSCFVRENQIQSLQPARWFIMFTLYGIDPGTYTVDINLVDNTDATKTFTGELYFRPVTEMTHINTSGPQNYIIKQQQDNAYVGTFNSGSATNTFKNVSFSDDPNGEYYVMINADHRLNDLQGCIMQLKSIVLTKAQKAPAATAEPTIPDFNVPADTDTDNAGFPVAAIVAIAAVAVVAVVVVVVVVSKKKKNSAE